ncbi:MAG: hypothetical protein A2V83_03240 [Nitrospirae bacterium RBG_16_64_22]|nr:MAG: hypothetical protein A2V83_03240 [Nitrospirae bacterium RBG_16_64_22]
MSERNVMNDKTNEPEKLDLESHHIADDKRDEMLRLFPDIRSRNGGCGQGAHGMTWQAALRQPGRK